MSIAAEDRIDNRIMYSVGKAAGETGFAPDVLWLGIPYWTKALGKNSLTAYQASRRGGTLYCTQEADRIKMSGKAAVYAESELYIEA